MSEISIRCITKCSWLVLCKSDSKRLTSRTRYEMASPKLPLRFQVPNNHILTQNLYYNYYYANPKYLIMGTWTVWVLFSS